ncbi:MAG: CoA transferase, partial [Oscillospiraceae bacterium]|nr:CoA transferase [Oscillospiraceae bacterium]
LEALLKLLDQADVFIVNVREQSLQRLGLDYENLKERFPRLIYAQITGYGDTGPDKDLPAFDTSAFWAATGFINDISLDVPDGLHQPVDTPASVGDCTTGLALYGAVMTALYARERTGKGTASPLPCSARRCGSWAT